MHDPAGDGGTDDLGAERADRARDRRGELLASVRAGPVVVLDVLAEDRLQVAARQDEQMVEAVLSHRAPPALGDGVGPRGAHRDLDSFDAEGGEHRVEAGGELGVAVSYAEPEVPAGLFELRTDVEPVQLRARTALQVGLSFARPPQPQGFFGSCDRSVGAVTC